VKVTPGAMSDHKCPKNGCRVRVPNSKLACRTHWYQLSKPVRDAVYATAHLGLLHPDRRAALDAALEEWNGAR
jgi:hypothetical protein